jgi:hypothetical protein
MSLSKSVAACVGAAIGVAILVVTARLSADQVASANPAPRAPLNTGSPPEPGFLADLTHGYDEETHYLSDYRMDENWIRIVYRPQNVRFDRSGMTLELYKTRKPLPFSGSEFQRKGMYGYGRYEVVLTPSRATGAVTSFFTYTGEFWGDPHDEIDFEFVAKRPREVYLNYFNNGENDPLSVPLWFDPSRGHHVYAFEWTPDSIRWYADGVKIREVTAANSPVGIPRTTGRVIANLWAGTGHSTGWTGKPNFSQTKASYRCMSHVPMGQTGRQCSDVYKPPAAPTAGAAAR